MAELSPKRSSNSSANNESQTEHSHNNNSKRNTPNSVNSADHTKQQQFCLRWNNYQTNLINVFDQLLQNESFVDVTLVCDGGNSIKAHKIMLSACSPYFQGLLFDNPCQHPIIIMHDVKWTELKVIVEFMYKGEINVCQDQIGPLLRVADMLKIRGLADVHDDHELNVTIPVIQPTNSNATTATVLPRDLTATKMKNSQPNNMESVSECDSKSDKDILSPMPTDNRQMRQYRKRRWSSTETCENDNNQRNVSTPDPQIIGEKSSSQLATELMKISPNLFQPPSATPTPPTFMIPPSIEAMGLSSLMMNQGDDMEIKPEIAEMIREEERAKFMENSNVWLGSSSPMADSYQYQLQSMWQKMWNSNSSMRFRERGPLKSWKPETMAEAILSVLKDGLSLSQAARKYDIPYPTFVLYANRVHNMLGPSVEAGIDVRPKGRGRPQRILLGIWPDEHIKGVVKSVVFRDVKELRDEPMPMGYGRDFLMYQPDGQLQYQGLPGPNGFNQSSVNALIQSYKCSETIQSHPHSS